MIRIIDEPVFEMTMDGPGTWITDHNFESWLTRQGWPHTVLGRIKP